MPNSKKKNKKLLVSKIHAHCSECGARTCSILKDCSPEALDKISFAKKCFVYLKGQRILMEGVESNGIYFINSGKLKIYKTDMKDKQLIIRFAKSGEVLGFSDNDEKQEQAVSAMALDDTLVCYLDNKSFLNVIREYPDIAFRLLRYYNKLLDQSETQSLKLARMNVPAKVADALYTIYETYGTNGNSSTLNLQLSRQDMADLAGTTKEQISKTLSDFKAHGLVNVKGKRIDILNLQALAEFSEV
jgi:CRP/FNR family transcriptional regulator